MSIRQCPRCNSFSVRRSRRRGFVEFMLPLFLMRPYRCSVCFRRHYGFILRSRHGYAPPRWEEAIHPLAQAVPLACLLLVVGVVTFLFSSPSYGLKLLDGMAGSHVHTGGLEFAEQTDATPALVRQQPSGMTTSSPEAVVGPAAMGDTFALAAHRRGSLFSLPLVPQRQPIGSLRASGEVLVNEFRVPETTTVYPGDAVRTGLDGSAGVEVPNKGTILISPQTQISFNPSGYLAKLTEGSVSLKTTKPVTDFQIQIGQFVVIPQPDVENVAAEIERTADGSARVKALTGSVGVIDLGGVQTVFISAGEEVVISSDGVLSRVGAAPRLPAPPTPQPAGPEVRSIPTRWLYVAGAGGGAGVAVALAAGGDGASPTLSPSIP